LIELLKAALHAELQFLLFLAAVVAVSAIVSKLISTTYYKIFGRKGIWLTGWIGVPVHELSHALFCLLFRHKITKISLFQPGKDQNVGFVMHSFNQKSLYQSIGNFFISFAPVFAAPLLAAALYFFLVDKNLPGNEILSPDFSWRAIVVFAKEMQSLLIAGGYQSLIWIYLAVCLAAHMNLSTEDLQVSLKGGLIVVLLLYPLLCVFFYFGNSAVPHWAVGWLKLWLLFFVLLLAVALLISLVLLLLRAVFLLFGRF